LKYFEFPLNIKVIANNHLTFVTAGVSVGIPLGAKLKNNRTGEKEDINKKLAALNISANFGVGIQFHIGAPIICIEARYSQSITNLSDSEIPISFLDEKVKSNSLYMIAGIMLTL
jgi:hypothetical protein